MQGYRGDKPVVVAAIVAAVLVTVVLGVGALVGLIRVAPTISPEGQADLTREQQLRVPQLRRPSTPVSRIASMRL